MMNPTDFNYIASVLDFGNSFELTIADISTGELKVQELKRDENDLLNELLNLGVKEVVLADNLDVELINNLKNNYGIELTISKELLNTGLR